MKVRASLGAKAFAHEASGVAAVEFAIILPVALLLMALVVYGGQIYRVQRKVSLAAATAANLVAQGGDTSQASISSAEMTQILAYPNLFLYPNDATYLQVVVTELKVSEASPGVYAGTVVGSWANGNGTPRACAATLPLDPNIAAAFTGAAGANPTNSFVVLGEVQYSAQHPFQPYDLFGSVSAKTLADSALMIPRTAAEIQGPSMCP